MAEQGPGFSPGQIGDGDTDNDGTLDRYETSGGIDPFDTSANNSDLREVNVFSDAAATLMPQVEKPPIEPARNIPDFIVRGLRYTHPAFEDYTKNAYNLIAEFFIDKQMPGIDPKWALQQMADTGMFYAKCIGDSLNAGAKLAEKITPGDGLKKVNNVWRGVANFGSRVSTELANLAADTNAQPYQLAYSAIAANNAGR